MKSVPLRLKTMETPTKPLSIQWENVDHHKEKDYENFAWACTLYGLIYADRGDAQHCFNTHNDPDMPSVKKRKKPLIALGKVDPATLDQKLVNEWT